MDLSTMLALGQGVGYLLTGVWPLVSMGTFLRVTGPKTDLWLVKTVGALVSVVGVVLLLAGLRHHVSLEIRLLAMGGALALAGMDVVYVTKRVIGRVYLLDAVAEAGLAALWALAWGIGR